MYFITFMNGHYLFDDPTFFYFFVYMLIKVIGMNIHTHTYKSFNTTYGAINSLYVIFITKCTNKNKKKNQKKTKII